MGNLPWKKQKRAQKIKFSPLRVVKINIQTALKTCFPARQYQNNHMEGSGERGSPKPQSRTTLRQRLLQGSRPQWPFLTRWLRAARQRGRGGGRDMSLSDGQPRWKAEDRAQVPAAQLRRRAGEGAGCVLTILSRALGSWVALSKSSLYSSSSQSLCSVLRGSLSSTGMATLDRSFPMLFLRMFHKLTLLDLGHGAGRHVLLLDLASPPLSITGPEREISLVALWGFSFYFTTEKEKEIHYWASMRYC